MFARSIKFRELKAHGVEVEKSWIAAEQPAEMLDELANVEAKLAELGDRISPLADLLRMRIDFELHTNIPESTKREIRAESHRLMEQQAKAEEAKLSVKIEEERFRIERQREAIVLSREAQAIAREANDQKFQIRQLELSGRFRIHMVAVRAALLVCGGVVAVALVLAVSGKSTECAGVVGSMAAIVGAFIATSGAKVAREQKSLAQPDKTDDHQAL